MKIVLIIYAVSWLILLAAYIGDKLKNKSAQKEETLGFKLFFIFSIIFLAPLLLLIIPCSYIGDIIKSKKIKKILEENRKKSEEGAMFIHKLENDAKRRARAWEQKYSIAFKNIQFTPECDQVIYVENLFDETVNNFIRENYDEFVEEFRKNKLEFVYLPMYFNASEQKEKMQYYAPYLTPQTNEQTSSSYLLDFMLHPENRVKISPSLLFCPKQRQDEYEWAFLAIRIDDMIEDNATVSDIVQKVDDVSVIITAVTGIASDKAEFQIVTPREEEKSISEEVSEPDAPYASQQDAVEDDSEKTRFRVVEETGDKEPDEDSGIRFRKVVHDEDEELLFRSADEEKCKKDSGKTMFRIIGKKSKTKEDRNYNEFFEEFRNAIPQIIEDEKITENELDADTALEICEILFNLQTTVKTLRFKGIALGAIHKFIDKQEPLSPLVITEDLRLFLPLYNNIEIELSAQKKALYFLFLNHPEGIILQHLADYHNELVNYYKQANNGVLTEKMEDSIKKLETYGNNQLHVVIARIREAFCIKFDERLARNYFIRGEKGQPYSISLDQELIKWED